MHVLRAFMASWAHLMFAVTSVKEDWHLDWSESKVTSQTVRHCARVTANPLLQDTITIAEAAKPAVTNRRFQCIGVVGTPNYRGMPLRQGASIHRPRQRSSLRQRIHPPHPGDGIRDRPTSFRSPWQNGHVERLIGSIRRECTDHLIVLNEEHLRRILAKFSTYYNGWRPHVSLGKDAPDGRPIDRFGDIVAHAILGGLHHRYARI